jgi:site-specific DNA recombinase
VLCQHCGYAYYGKPVSSSAAKGKVREYAYYRCIGTDAYRFGGERICHNGQVRTDLLDVTVWQEVCALLEDPQRVEQEYRRRLAPADADERPGIESQVGKLRQGLARLIDSYAEGLIEKAEFEPRISRLRERMAALEEQAQQLAQAATLQDDLRLIIGRLDEFAARVKGGLAEADWPTKRELIRALVKRVEVGKEDVNIVFRVSPDPFVESPDRGVLQHCGRRAQPIAHKRGSARTGTGSSTTVSTTGTQRVVSSSQRHPLCR